MENQNPANIICAICLDPTGESAKILECAHRFHSSCIDTWIAKKNSCPTCRHPVLTTNPALIVDLTSYDDDESDMDVSSGGDLSSDSEIWSSESDTGTYPGLFTGIFWLSAMDDDDDDSDLSIVEESASEEESADNVSDDSQDGQDDRDHMIT